MVRQRRSIFCLFYLPVLTLNWLINGTLPLTPPPVCVLPPFIFYFIFFLFRFGACVTSACPRNAQMYPTLAISHVEESKRPATIHSWCKKGLGRCQTHPLIVLPYRCLGETSFKSPDMKKNWYFLYQSFLLHLVLLLRGGLNKNNDTNICETAANKHILPKKSEIRKGINFISASLNYVLLSLCFFSLFISNFLNINLKLLTFFTSWPRTVAAKLASS